MKGVKIHHPIIKTIDMNGNIGSFEPFLKTLLSGIIDMGSRGSSVQLPDKACTNSRP